MTCRANSARALVKYRCAKSLRLLKLGNYSGEAHVLVLYFDILLINALLRPATNEFDDGFL